MVHFSHALVRGINDLWRSDGEVEHLDGQDRVHEGLGARVVGAGHQPKQVFPELGGDDFEVLKDVARGDFNGFRSLVKRFKFNRGVLHRHPVLVATEIVACQDGGADHLGIDDIATEQAKENLCGFHEDLSP